MKSLIIYKSKTGFTKKYAKWIQKAAGGDILNCDIITKESIIGYDTIIYGSRIHAGKIQGLKKIRSIIQNQENLKFIVFATGATPIDAKDVIESIWKASFSEEELRRIPHFYMPSGLNYEKMGHGDHLIMKAFAKMLGNKKDKNPVELGCEEAIGSSYDITSKDYIIPLLEYLKSAE